MSTLYTSGDWTVSSLPKDTSTTQLSLMLPDLSYTTDYAVVQDDPGEAKITNTTGNYLWSPETIRFAASTVKNVYANTDIDPTLFAPVKSGVQVMSEVAELYMATNSKTGAEVVLPCKGRVVLRFPTGGVVGEALLSNLVGRTIASLYPTGTASISRVVDMARFSLLPRGM